MKKLLLLLLCVPFISICQLVTPKIDRYYITSDAGYSGCKDEYTLTKLFKYSSENDNDNFIQIDSPLNHPSYPLLQFLKHKDYSTLHG